MQVTLIKGGEILKADPAQRFITVRGKRIPISEHSRSRDVGTAQRHHAARGSQTLRQAHRAWNALKQLAQDYGRSGYKRKGEAYRHTAGLLPSTVASSLDAAAHALDPMRIDMMDESELKAHLTSVAHDLSSAVKEAKTSTRFRDKPELQMVVEGMERGARAALAAFPKG